MPSLCTLSKQSGLSLGGMDVIVPISTNEHDIKAGRISISVYIVVGYAMHAREGATGETKRHFVQSYTTSDFCGNSKTSKDGSSMPWFQVLCRLLSYCCVYRYCSQARFLEIPVEVDHQDDYLLRLVTDGIDELMCQSCMDDECGWYNLTSLYFGQHDCA